MNDEAPVANVPAQVADLDAERKRRETARRMASREECIQAIAQKCRRLSAAGHATESVFAALMLVTADLATEADFNASQFAEATAEAFTFVNFRRAQIKASREAATSSSIVVP